MKLKKEIERGASGQRVESYTSDEGGVWENKELSFYKNYEVGSLDNGCCHVHEGCIPLVVVAGNEGGYSSTGACVQCIIEAARQLEAENEPH